MVLQRPVELAGIIGMWPKSNWGGIENLNISLRAYSQRLSYGILLLRGCLMDVDEDKVDDMVLALLYLTMFEDKPRLRAWKGHSWGVLDRLHRKDYISDPATKAKSVLLTEAGAKRSQHLFERYFTK